MSMDLKKRPILLLDDVLSELDHNRQNNLLALLTNNVQTFITTTDIDNIDESIIKNSQIIDIETLTKEGR
jgi:DNA replication and repair protein RecF